MKPPRRATRYGKKESVMKRTKRLAMNALKRRLRAGPPPQKETARVRVNDPLAIGIESLGRSFWPRGGGNSLRKTSAKGAK
jgi:hypothetical protein